MVDTLVDSGNLVRGTDYTVDSTVVGGGTLYITSLLQGNTPQAIATAFVGNSASGGTLRFMSLTNAKADTGVAITGTATGGAVGVSRTAGTSLVLLGEATSGSAKTDKAFFETNLPDSYIPGAAIPVVVNAAVLGTGTLTTASTTISVAAYTEVAGVETALTVSAGQTLNAVLQAYTFSVTGTALVASQHIGLEVTGLVTSSSGANTLEIASVALSA